jgi:hypothetical protein
LALGRRRHVARCTCRPDSLHQSIGRTLPRGSQRKRKGGPRLRAFASGIWYFQLAPDYLCTAGRAPVASCERGTLPCGRCRHRDSHSTARLGDRIPGRRASRSRKNTSVLEVRSDNHHAMWHCRDSIDGSKCTSDDCDSMSRISRFSYVVRDTRAMIGSLASSSLRPPTRFASQTLAQGRGSAGVAMRTRTRTNLKRREKRPCGRMPDSSCRSGLLATW